MKPGAREIRTTTCNICVRDRSFVTRKNAGPVLNEPMLKRCNGGLIVIVYNFFFVYSNLLTLSLSQHIQIVLVLVGTSIRTWSQAVFCTYKFMRY